jgi:hypothetical protein
MKRSWHVIHRENEITSVTDLTAAAAVGRTATAGSPAITATSGRIALVGVHTDCCSRASCRHGRSSLVSGSEAAKPIKESHGAIVTHRIRAAQAPASHQLSVRSVIGSAKGSIASAVEPGGGALHSIVNLMLSCGSPSTRRCAGLTSGLGITNLAGREWLPRTSHETAVPHHGSSAYPAPFCHTRE